MSKRHSNKLSAKDKVSHKSKAQAPHKKTGKINEQNKQIKKDVEGEYEVELILDSRIDEVTKKPEFFVKWKGWDSKDNTW